MLLLWKAARGTSETWAAMRSTAARASAATARRATHRSRTDYRIETLNKYQLLLHGLRNQHWRRYLRTRQRALSRVMILATSARTTLVHIETDGEHCPKLLLLIRPYRTATYDRF